MPTQAVWQTSGDHSLYGFLATGAIVAIFCGLLVKKPHLLVGPNRGTTTRRPGRHPVSLPPPQTDTLRTREPSATDPPARSAGYRVPPRQPAVQPTLRTA